MEEKLCQHCKIRHAARSYADPKTPQKREFYCLECYSRLFIDEEGADEPTCAFCGTTLAEAQKTKIVGCAHCYTTMQTGLTPMIRNMQGGRAHAGKTPPIEGYSEPSSLGQYRQREIERARFERQCRELEIIIEKLKAEEKFEDAKGYAEKLAAMKNRLAIEEDFVWRTRRSSLKQR